MMISKSIIQYENDFAAQVSGRYAFSFWKGRVALFAILKALDIGPEDEVILPGFTCVVVPNAIRFAGAKPVFADIKPGAYNLDPAAVERAITARSRVLIIQHTFGIPADIDALLEIAKRHNLPVIEDCAQSLGSTYHGQPVGSFGNLAFFSSQWSKPYTTGLGGIAVTNDPGREIYLRKAQSEFRDPPAFQIIKLYLQYELYRRFFSPRLYWPAFRILHLLSRLNLFIGSSGKEELAGEMPADITWRMSAFQARIGLENLKMLPRNLAHRSRLAGFYRQYLSEQGWRTAKSPMDSETIFLRYPVNVANKWDLLRRAEEAKVELGSWFESALHPIRSSWDKFAYRPGQCPIAERTADQVVNLPVHSRISLDEAERIAGFFCRTAEKPCIQGVAKNTSAG